MNKNTRGFMFDGLKAILGDGGLAFAGTHFEPSISQRDYSQHITEAIIRSAEKKTADPGSPASIILTSADTGTGKTMGYGVPLLLKAAKNKADGMVAGKVVIATHTHALQRQFFGSPEDLGDIVKIAQWVSDLGFGELSFARRLGRQAFISLSAVEKTIAQLKSHRKDLNLSAQDIESLQSLRDFAEQANEGESSGLIEDIRTEFEDGNLPLGITASNICMGSDSNPEDSRAYDDHLANAENADVVIVSHAFLAACALFRGGVIFSGGIDCLVIDEADRLSEAAASAFKFDMSLRRSAAAMGRLPGELAQEAHTAMVALADCAQAIYTNKPATTLLELSPAVRSNVLSLTTQVKGLVGELVSKFSKKDSLSKDDLDDLTRFDYVIKKFLKSSEHIENGEAAKSSQFLGAISYSPLRSLPSIAVAPINPGAIISRLWNLQKTPIDDNVNGKLCPVNCVVLTSATLGAPGRYPDAVERFKSFAHGLGIAIKPSTYQTPELDLWSYFEPENFGAVKFITSLPSTPNPSQGLDDDSNSILNVDWLAYTVTMIEKAKSMGGRSLVLCNSYKDTKVLSELLIGKGIQVIAQERGQSTGDCVKSFLADVNAVWLSPTAWEGLNLPGAIANIVIPRLPFAAISHVDKALLKAYGTLTDKSVDNIIAARMMNDTKRKLRQGMFRAIRARTDKARIWIADPRFPMHPQSQIPLRHPAEIKYSGVRRYPAFHSVVPGRFQRALEFAEIMKIDGKLLN